MSARFLNYLGKLSHYYVIRISRELVTVIFSVPSRSPFFATMTVNHCARVHDWNEKPGKKPKDAIYRQGGGNVS